MKEGTELSVSIRQHIKINHTKSTSYKWISSMSKITMQIVYIVQHENFSLILYRKYNYVRWLSTFSKISLIIKSVSSRLTSLGYSLRKQNHETIFEVHRMTITVLYLRSFRNMYILTDDITFFKL